MSVLVGKDAPELLDLLNETDSTENTLAVLTRAQTRRQQEEEEKLVERDRLSEACPKAVSNETPTASPLEQNGPAEPPSNAADTLLFSFKPELFKSARSWARKSRKAKREERQAY